MHDGRPSDRAVRPGPGNQDLSHTDAPRCAVLTHYGIAPGDPETWLYLEDGAAYTSIDAMIRVGSRIGGWGKALRVLRVLPRPVQDWFYRRIARNRYRLFGRTDMCAVPDPDLRARLME